MVGSLVHTLEIRHRRLQLGVALVGDGGNAVVGQALGQLHDLIRGDARALDANARRGVIGVGGELDGAVP